MNTKRLKTLSLLAALGLAALPTAQADTKALINTLRENGVLTQEQADRLLGSTVIVTPNRPTVSELKIRGRIQGQFAYVDGSNSNFSGSPSNYSTLEIRRAQLGVQGRLFDDYRFQIEMNTLPSGVDLNSAFISWHGVPEANIIIGKAKPRFGHEENTSSASILTMERSNLTNIFQGGKPVGVRVTGRMDAFDYYAGFFNSTSTSGTVNANGISRYYWNGSVGLDLAKLMENGPNIRFRLDALHNPNKQSGYAFDHAVAFSTHGKFGDFDLRMEYIWGKQTRIGGDPVTKGWYFMPSYRFTPHLEGVFRFESVRSDRNNLQHQSRYARRASGIFNAGDDYKSYYFGLNYYIRGDNFKYMMGLDMAELRGSGDGINPKSEALTFYSGIRMQY